MKAPTNDTVRKAAEKNYDEISEIRQDLDSLKSNVVALTRHLKEDGRDKVQELRAAIAQGLEALKEKGSEGMETLDGEVKANPRRSLAFAFLAGVVANLLLTRK